MTALGRSGLLALQGAAGNRAVSGLVGRSGGLAVQPSRRLPVQRAVFVGGSAHPRRVFPEDPALATVPYGREMAADDTMRHFTDWGEFTRYACGGTTHLGNLAASSASPGTWVRFSPDGLNLLGEQHNHITIFDVLGAVGSDRFVAELISSDGRLSSVEYDAVRNELMRTSVGRYVGNLDKDAFQAWAADRVGESEIVSNGSVLATILESLSERIATAGRPVSQGASMEDVAWGLAVLDSIGASWQLLRDDEDVAASVADLDKPLIGDLREIENSGALHLLEKAICECQGDWSAALRYIEGLPRPAGDGPEDDLGAIEHYCFIMAERGFRRAWWYLDRDMGLERLRQRVENGEFSYRYGQYEAKKYEGYLAQARERIMAQRVDTARRRGYAFAGYGADHVAGILHHLAPFGRENSAAVTAYDMTPTAGSALRAFERDTGRLARAGVQKPIWDWSAGGRSRSRARGGVHRWQPDGTLRVPGSQPDPGAIDGRRVLSAVRGDPAWTLHAEALAGRRPASNRIPDWFWS